MGGGGGGLEAREGRGGGKVVDKGASSVGK